MSRLRVLAVPLAFCLGGLLLAHHEMLLTGFRFTQNDLGDTRFCNYLLEHGWRWLTRQRGHLSLWSPPYFFPATDTLAYAENMLGSMPLYGVFRAVGFEVDTAFQLWILSVSTLNFVSAYLLFHRCFKLSALPASVGAALFAFAAIRVNQTMHFQVFPHFFTVLCAHAAFRLLEHGALERPRRTRVAFIALFAFGLAGQIYACVYLGWYLGFVLALATVLGLGVPAFRRPLLLLIRTHPVSLALAGLAAVGVTAPLLLRYAEVSKLFGLRPFEEVRSMIPLVSSWFHLGRFSWLYSGLSTLKAFQGIPMEHEQRCGFGFVTTALCVGGLVLGRRSRPVLFFGLLFGAVLVLSTVYGPWTTGLTPWQWVYAYFPGAKAIRAVSRIGILLLLPVGLGVGVLLERLREKGRAGLAGATALGLFCLLEQGQTTPSFEKQQNREDIHAIASQVDPRCGAFLFSPVQGYGPYWKYQLDAMMASLESHVPTVNGYSGHEPPGWYFGDVNLHTDENLARVQLSISNWTRQNHLDPAQICWVKVRLEEGPYQATFVSQKVPPAMVAGQRYPVELTLRNRGVTVWSPLQGFRLGAQTPRDNTSWGMNRVPLGEDVPPGKDAVFHFEVQAPSVPGTYPFQWQLLREGVMWFPEMTRRVEVVVERK